MLESCSMSSGLTRLLPDIQTTEAFGLQLAAELFQGSVVALVGELGAGKTLLVRSIASALGVTNDRLVTSPTFVLVQEYMGRWPVFHFDAYRLRSPSEFFELGIEEYYDAGGVCLIEWADRVEPCLPRDYLRVTLEVLGESSRRVTLKALGKRYAGLVATMASASSLS
jgi:tRNA threonylcarbamoyladenosine biosynthesis protein TsaE